jgi:hypothetical protein
LDYFLRRTANHIAIRNPNTVSMRSSTIER